MKHAIYLVLDMENDLVHAEGPNGKAPYGGWSCWKTRAAVCRPKSTRMRSRACGDLAISRTPKTSCSSESPVAQSQAVHAVHGFRPGSSDARRPLGKGVCQ